MAGKFSGVGVDVDNLHALNKSTVCSAKGLQNVELSSRAFSFYASLSDKLSSNDRNQQKTAQQLFDILGLQGERVSDDYLESRSPRTPYRQQPCTSYGHGPFSSATCKSRDPAATSPTVAAFVQSTSVTMKLPSVRTPRITISQHVYSLQPRQIIDWA